MAEFNNSIRLSPADLKKFTDQGYLIFPEFLSPEHSKSLIAEVDLLMLNRSHNDQRLVVGYKELGLLTSHPPMMNHLNDLLGPSFMMHHIHAARHDEGMKGVVWHQDYEQYPQTNRSHMMVHVFYYPNGLNGEIGDLLVLPGSQNVLVQGDLPMLGTENLPGCICIDSLQAGSAVVVHSGLWHARRPQPGGESRPRHFIDISYCEHGILWPAYREYSTTELINAEALELGLDRNGRYAHLYDTSQFFDHQSLEKPFQILNQGSLMHHMLGEESDV